MSEKLEKLRAMLEKEKDRRIKLNNRIEILERRIQEAEAAEVNEMVRTAKVTPEQLAALLRQSATSTPNPATLAAVGATFDKEDDSDETGQHYSAYLQHVFWQGIWQRQDSNDKRTWLRCKGHIANNVNHAFPYERNSL